MKTELFHLHALSALHVGVGQAVGTVDLPIARAKATHLPLVPGSALKGVLRDEFIGNPDQTLLFGPERISDAESAHAGAVAFGDAHLLLLPVRSLAGVMAWATCPFVLTRYAADARRAGVQNLPEVPKIAAGKVGLAATTDLILTGNKVVFDDLDLDAEAGKADAWAAHFAQCLFAGDEDSANTFAPNFALLSDSDLGFLADTGTEIRARIRVNDETGTVAKGALWYEENLPAESVLWGILGIGPGRTREPCDAQSTAQRLREGVGHGKLLQIGGKATVGRGLVRFLATGDAA